MRTSTLRAVDLGDVVTDDRIGLLHGDSEALGVVGPRGHRVALILFQSVQFV